MATILFRTLIVYFIIAAVFRFMGKRQVGDMELSDLVSTLLLSELATLPIADHNIPLINALLPILIIVCLEVLLTFGKNRSHLLKKLLEGKPSILICRGHIDRREMDRMRISIEELISECRLQGCSDISDVYYAILEQDGKLSVLPRADKQPLCASDIGRSVEEHGLAHPVILDGRINDHHLSLLGLDRAWLKKECGRRGVKTEDVFLMTVDDAGDISLFRKEKKKK